MRSSSSEPDAADAQENRPSLGKVLASAFLPGALAGTQLTGLLFFLNPHLPFDLPTVLRGVSLYGGLLGCASLLVLGPFFARRGERIRRWLPIALTLVLAAAALSAWIHASQLAFFLPSGINRRLVKAAISLSIAAVVCFYTALVHQVGNRRYGRRSYLLFFLLALISVYVVFERREAFRPHIRPEPRATLFEGGSRPSVLVVGLESATLDAILPLAEQGKLPFFSGLLQDGAHGRLQSLSQRRRSALWATLVVGKYPYRHAVVDDRIFGAPLLGPDCELRLLPLGLSFESWGWLEGPRRTDGNDLQARPLWKILSQLGLSSAVVGWPLGYPASEVTNISIGEDFFALGDETLVTPMALGERARLFRTRLDELDPVHANRFGPTPPAVILESMAGDLWRRDLTLFLLDQQPETESLFLLLPGLGKVSQSYFGGFASASFEGAQEPESVEAALLLGAYYGLVDEILGQLWDQLRPPRLMVVVSPHGIRGPSGLREAWRRLLRKPATEGYLSQSAEGVFLIRGDGIRPGSMLRPAQLVDLAPTVLYGLGLPIARDFDGVVLTDAFDTSFLAHQPLTLVPSYETLAIIER